MCCVFCDSYNKWYVCSCMKTANWLENKVALKQGGYASVDPLEAKTKP